MENFQETMERKNLLEKAFTPIETTSSPKKGYKALI